MTAMAASRNLTRRRFISVSAAFGAATFVGGAATATPLVQAVRWRGVVLGAEAEIIIYHPDPDLARHLIAAGIDEVARLESLFSLYRADSELVALNAAGKIDRPSHDLLRLLTLSHRISGLTDGAFDVSVQPLWRLYADHFSRPDCDPAGPGGAAITAVARRVDYRAITFNSREVRFDKPGMALTFNGIAQGYITDRVADLLRRGGLDHVLTNLGEIQATGGAPGRPWRIESPATGGVLEVMDDAVATSQGSGTTFDGAGRHHHLLDPHSGLSAEFYDAVTVLGRDAATADALSTALYMLPPDRAKTVLAALPDTRAYFKFKEPYRG